MLFRNLAADALVLKECVDYYEKGMGWYTSTPNYMVDVGFMTQDEYWVFESMEQEQKEAMRHMFLVILLLELGESL